MPTLKRYTGTAWETIAVPSPPPSVPWDPWTPTWTNFTVGNGTVLAKFVRDGRAIHWRLKVVLGSTSVMGSNPSFTLPTAMHSDYHGFEHLGQLSCSDTGFATYGGIVYKLSDTTLGLAVNKTDGTYSLSAGFSATVPFSWGDGDLFQAMGTYEAAS